MKRVVIVASAQSYRTADFLRAATLLHLDTVVATDDDMPLDRTGRLHIDLSDLGSAADAIASLDPAPDAVVAVDDQGVAIAAEAARRLGIPHNSTDAVKATRDKLAMRELLAAGEVPQPRFRAAAMGEVPAAARELGYPVVVKPRGLSASRGVIRADTDHEARDAELRIRRILEAAGRYPGARLLVEQYVPGREVAVEGLLDPSGLKPLAVIDKPEPLEGPFFEETLYVTPSRLGESIQREVLDVTAAAARAIGLTTGPIHAESRIPPGGGPILIEIAARSIGGLCGRALTFGLPNESLEVLILRSAVGAPTIDSTPARPASGVLMMPIPATGTLSSVEGVEEALDIPGVDDVQVTIPRGKRVVALPEGDRYLGFIFASGADPESVERSLREAGNTISVAIDGEEIRPSVALADPGTV